MVVYVKPRPGFNKPVVQPPLPSGPFIVPPFSRQLTRKVINVDEVRKSILEWPGLYETEDGEKWLGMPVSQVPSQLRDSGWRNVGRYDAGDFRGMGLQVRRARYIGGAHPKRFCDVVLVKPYVGKPDDPYWAKNV